MTGAKLAMIEQKARNLSIPNPLGIWMTKIRLDDLKWMVEKIKENEDLNAAYVNAQKEILILKNKLEVQREESEVQGKNHT